MLVNARRKDFSQGAYMDFWTGANNGVCRRCINTEIRSGRRTSSLASVRVPEGKIGGGGGMAIPAMIIHSGMTVPVMGYRLYANLTHENCLNARAIRDIPSYPGKTAGVRKVQRSQPFTSAKMNSRGGCCAVPGSNRNNKPACRHSAGKGLGRIFRKRHRWRQTFRAVRYCGLRRSRSALCARRGNQDSVLGYS